MFTGIIQAVGRIAQIESGEQDIRLRIETGKLPLAEVSLGDSIASSGVCLTVTELPGDGFWADVSPETLSLTTLGHQGCGRCGESGNVAHTQYTPWWTLGQRTR